MSSINKLKKILRSIDGQSRINICDCINQKYEYFNGVELMLQQYDYIKYEIVKMVISIPKALLPIDISVDSEIFTADYLLRHFSPQLHLLNKGYQNKRRDKRLQCELFLCPYDSRIIKRNASQINAADKTWELTVLARIPCIGINSINGKLFSKFISDLIRTVSETIENIDIEDYNINKCLYVKQQCIRKYLKNHNSVCFIANGSIIPRIENSCAPCEHAVKFISPDSLEISIEFDDNTSIKGMLLKHGITVIVGGAYSGKSTLIDAIEEGIYDHILGDGRELILTDRSALKTNAEDGRPVNCVDLSPFFSSIPPKSSSSNFSTVHASGSVSQAANIIEAVYSGSKLILIDEDSSATNFLVRDQNMRKIIKSDPITPLTDRITQLSNMGISTILVIGALSDYLPIANTVILMEDFLVKDITDIVTNNSIHTEINHFSKTTWTENRHLWIEQTDNPDVPIFYSINDGSCIVIGKFITNVSRLTALTTKPQINALYYSLLYILSHAENYSRELSVVAERAHEQLFSESWGRNHIYSPEEYWIESIRPIDICCALNRLNELKDKDIICSG